MGQLTCERNFCLSQCFGIRFRMPIPCLCFTRVVFQQRHVEKRMCTGSGSVFVHMCLYRHRRCPQPLPALEAKNSRPPSPFLGGFVGVYVRGRGKLSQVDQRQGASTSGGEMCPEVPQVGRVRAHSNPRAVAGCTAPRSNPARA